MRTLRRFGIILKATFIYLLKSVFFFVHRKGGKSEISLHRLVAVVVSGLVLLAFARINLLVDGHGPNLIRLAVKQ